MRQCVLGLVVVVAGCFGLRPAVEPMPVVELARGPEGAECLLVLLPGRGDGPRDFLEEDWAGIALEAGVVADVVAVDSHLGYFRERTLARRLHEDVVAPARRDGKRVWLAGISLGGLASLLYLAEHPGEVEGAVLLAPFLGTGAALEEVAAAPSLAAWEPARTPVEPPRGDDVWRKLWLRIRGLTDGEPGTGAPPPAAAGEGGDPEGADGDDSEAPWRHVPDPVLHLAYGSGDRLAESHRLLARELPPERVFTVDGGHDWAAWDELWRRVVRSGAIACR